MERTTRNHAATVADAEFAVVVRNSIEDPAERNEFDQRLARAIARTVEATGRDWDEVALEATADVGGMLKRRIFG